MRWRSSNSSIPSFIVCMCLKIVTKYFWENWVIFKPFIFFNPKLKSNNFFSSTWYACLLSISKSLPSIKHGSLVKLSKNVKIWRLHIISRLALSTVGIFHPSTNFFLKPKNSTLKFLTTLVKLLKFQHFTWLLGS